MLDRNGSCGMMSPQLDADQVRAWLDTLFSGTEGYINIVSTDNWTGQSFRDTGEATRYVELVDKRKPKGIYVRMTTLQKPLTKGRGGVADTREVVGYWADMDIEGPGHKWHVCPEFDCPDGDKPGHRFNDVPLIPTRIVCQQVIEASGLPAPTEWVSSGGGMYPLWLFRDPHDVSAPDGELLESFGSYSVGLQRIIELTAAKMGYHYGAGVGNLDRVLRIPGTVNRKVDGSPTLCEWRLDLSTSQPYEVPRLHGAVVRQLEILQPQPEKPEAIRAQPVAHFLQSQGRLPGEDYAARNTWRDILEADGCTVFRERGDYIEWTRPGKDRRDGGSGTTNHVGNDLLKVFSDSWQPLQDGKTYTKFGYYCEVHHGGDFNAATKALSGLGYGERKFERPATMTRPVDFNWEPEGAGLLAADAPTEQQLAEGVPQKLAEAAPRQQAAPTYTYTDSGFADRLEARYGDDWKYVASRQRFGWLKWNGTVWETDKKGAVTNLVDQLVKEEFHAVQQEPDEKKREKMGTSLRPMMSNAKHLGAAAIFSRRWRVAVEPDELDFHKQKLTCGNGVYDLDAMEFGPHDRSLMATKRLGVDYSKDAKAPRWDKFLAEVLPDPAVRDYLQRAAGYTLLGDPNAKALFLLHGPSNTGKSQVITILSQIFGSFAQATKEQTLRISDSVNGPTPGLHNMRGARLVTTSETSEGVRLDEALIKRLTGGDEITSRPLYGDEETWDPEFSIWLATNHLPKFSSDDDAIWRRVKPIAFNVVFGRDGRADTLGIGRSIVAEEGPGILNWLLEGVARYRQLGLAEPEAMVDGVTAYQRETDPVARFLDEAVLHGDLLMDPEAKIESKQLYNWFSQWCAEEGIRYPLPSNRFGRRLVTLGYQKAKDPSGSIRMWAGLKPGNSRWLIGGSGTRF